MLILQYYILSLNRLLHYSGNSNQLKILIIFTYEGECKQHFQTAMAAVNKTIFVGDALCKLLAKPAHFWITND